ncbi:hypothetical protein DINM_022982 [Dirofilaria immitis]|nr:hypothetical protein [Dirofilaria immitis]
MDGTAATLVPKNRGLYKFLVNDCGSSSKFSIGKFVNVGPAGINSAYPVEEALTTTAAKQNSPLAIVANESNQKNPDSKNSSMHCSRSFMRNVFRAEYSSIRCIVPLNERSTDVTCLNGSEHNINVSSPVYSLPPCLPSRSNLVGRSSNNRLPPPKYQLKNCIKRPAVSNKSPPPLSYKERAMTSTKQIAEFSSKEISTPKLEHNELDRDRKERNEKQ